MIGENLQRRTQIEEEIKRVQAQSESVAMRLRQGFDWGGDDADKRNDLVERAKVLALYRCLRQKHQQLVHAEKRVA